MLEIDYTSQFGCYGAGSNACKSGNNVSRTSTLRERT